MEKVYFSFCDYCFERVSFYMVGNSAGVQNIGFFVVSASPGFFWDWQWVSNSIVKVGGLLFEQNFSVTFFCIDICHTNFRFLWSTLVFIVKVEDYRRKHTWQTILASRLLNFHVYHSKYYSYIFTNMDPSGAVCQYFPVPCITFVFKSKKAPSWTFS